MNNRCSITYMYQVALYVWNTTEMTLEST
jgi:hypothetical protein